MGPEGGITWAHAEALAFASLLTEGVPVRLTGQDSARGTFSQRHLELHDVGEGETWTPAHRAASTRRWPTSLRASASLELHNSPLSEAAAVGFEYGYSTQAPEALVLWEAQYGDFANGAQIMIDQFIVSGRAKWGETSRLTLLLPHGYEGNGPEHSSARIERFLQAAAEDNIRVANCSTAANYFHLLRKQALTDRQRPLIIFTPKSLLRAKSASSRLEDLTDGALPAGASTTRSAADRRDGVTRLILCSGKVFHELDGHAEREAHPELAIGRVELLYPFPEDADRRALRLLPRTLSDGDLGAGGAAQHGRLGVHPAPARADVARRRSIGLRRSCAPREPQRGVPAGPPGRAGAAPRRGAEPGTGEGDERRPRGSSCWAEARPATSPRCARRSSAHR